MTITKHQHACVVIQQDSAKLVIDPGVLTADIPITPDISAIVVTHVHSDHCDPVKLQAMLQASPHATLYSTQEVAAAHPDLPVIVVQAGQTVDVQGLTVAFFGGEHATIHTSITPNQNIGVMVNSLFYYPGDSFTAPGLPVKLLALPVSAPWLKISESIDFISTVQPTQCFPTHNAILSPAGQSIVDGIMDAECKNQSIAYTPLTPGQTLQLS